VKVISLSRVGQLLIVTIGLLAAGCAGLRITPPADMTPIPETWGCQLLIFGEGALWSVEYEEKSGFRLEDHYFDYDYYFLRIDPETNKVAARVLIPKVPGWPNSIASGEGAVWAGFEGRTAKIYKIDPMTNRVVATIPVGSPRLFGRARCHLAAGEGAVWAASGGILFRVDPRSNEVTSIPLSRNVDFVSVGAGAVWALNQHFRGDTILRIDPRTHRLVATIPAPPSLWIGQRITPYTRVVGRWMTMGAGGMWVLLESRRYPMGYPTMVGLLDPQSNQFVATIDLPENLTAVDASGLTDIDAREAAIWAAVQEVELHYLIKEDTVYHWIVEIDSITKTVKRKVPCGSVSDGSHTPKFLAIGADAVWVYLPLEGIYRLPFRDGSSQRK